MEKFNKGTFGVCDAVAEVKANGGISIIGGGDSVSAVKKSGLADKMSHISTGGGASLEFLEGYKCGNRCHIWLYFISNNRINL